MVVRTIGAYGVVIAALFGCAATVEEPGEGGENQLSQTGTTVKASAPLAEARAGAIEQTEREQSRVLTLARRKEFHAALASRLELGGERKERFLSLLEEAEVERLHDTDEAGEEAARSRRVARLKALQELLGTEQLERYAELKETRNGWYRPSQYGRSAAVPRTLRADEGSSR